MRSGGLERDRARERERERDGGDVELPRLETGRESEGKKEVTDLLLWDSIGYTACCYRRRRLTKLTSAVKCTIGHQASALKLSPSSTRLPAVSNSA